TGRRGRPLLGPVCRRALDRRWPLAPSRAMLFLRRGGKRPRRACRIGEGGEDQPLAEPARRPCDKRRFGIDDDPAAARIDGGRPAEAEREVERLAEEEDEVGGGEDLGEGAERRIV